MLHASLKIYAALPGWSHGGHSLWRLSSQRPGAENGVHIRLELDLQVILVHLDLPDDELQIIALQGVLTENVPKTSMAVRAARFTWMMVLRLSESMSIWWRMPSIFFCRSASSSS